MEHYKQTNAQHTSCPHCERSCERVSYFYYVGCGGRYLKRSGLSEEDHWWLHQLAVLASQFPHQYTNLEAIKILHLDEPPSTS